jgi:hypothetical protein
MPSYDLRSVSEEDLVAKLANMVVRDHQLTADMLAHMAEVDTRTLYLKFACSSMFTYCVSRLKMTHAGAYKRIVVARAARRYPSIFGYVAAGELHLSAVKLLAPRLTPENHHSLLQAARNLSTRAVEELLATRFPKPDVPSSIRKLPERRPPAPPEAAATAAAPPPTDRLDDTSPPDQVPSSFVPPCASARPELKPLSAARYCLKLTVSSGTRDKLLKAQAFIRHQVPGGELDAVIDRALDALLRELRQNKFGETARPQKNPRPLKEGSRTIPKSVKREVAARDDYRCTFVDAQGRRCEEQAFLEFDHIQPVARGGTARSAEQVRLLCRAHNRHAAEQVFGKAFMKRRVAQVKNRAAGKLDPGRAPPAKARVRSQPPTGDPTAESLRPIKAGERSRPGGHRTGHPPKRR